MKKLLDILGAVGLTATGASSVVACNKEDKNDTPSNDLTDSFKSSYDASNAVADMGKYGVSAKDDKYNFDSANIDVATVNTLLTTGQAEGAKIKSVALEASAAVPTAADQLIAFVSGTATDLVATEDGKVEVTLTLTEAKAVEDTTVKSALVYADETTPTTTYKWEKTDTTMEVKISVVVKEVTPPAEKKIFHQL
ncbi:lipoprotein [Spiroplasma eriocheiris]|uniref:Lipoprotein n=1 Tax=Spiroplasma eriocheiris TaxID=315358 RepID=A0A0H3XHX7_9MOLU|nr:lipoprotein [Spiroplasma eriocheiris]AHF57563.1 hypothetical protein SPE_0434 [Spiroplasma eriocheiris CCTCC M 207170]AKM54020.1 hypothetical protein SERIO_v1c04410 [Spiroplasma eriocheiris]